MAYFNRDNRGGGGRSFGGGGRSFGGGRNFNSRGSDRGDRQMFHAVCSKCGKDCEVPFQPSGRPVFCSDCFRENRDSDPRRSEGNNYSRPRFDNRNEGRSENQGQNRDYPQFKEQFERLNNKIDKILNLLTAVTPSETNPEEHAKLVEVVQDIPIAEPETKTVKPKKSPKKAPNVLAE